MVGPWPLAVSVNRSPSQVPVNVFRRLSLESTVVIPFAV
jgi:hypothetical protein